MVDAFAHLGVTHMEMPHTSWRVWKQIKQSGVS
jgi:carbon-monoxide dehydrogenase large subunit